MKSIILIILLFLTSNIVGGPLEYISEMHNNWLKEVPSIVKIDIWTNNNYVSHPEGCIWPPDDTWQLWETMALEVPPCGWYGDWEYGGPLPDDIAVWEGDLISILQMEESRRYLNLYLINNTKSLTDEINFSGMPLIRNENYRLVFIDSEYSIENVEEFAEASIGEIPVSVGRISDKWYLIVNNAA